MTLKLKSAINCFYYLKNEGVVLHMQHNKDYAISLYACVARSASCEWLIISPQSELRLPLLQVVSNTNLSQWEFNLRLR